MRVPDTDTEAGDWPLIQIQHRNLELGADGGNVGPFGRITAAARLPAGAPPLGRQNCETDPVVWV